MDTTFDHPPFPLVTSFEVYHALISGVWKLGEPNGGRLENCAAVNRKGQLIDISCDSPLGIACNITPFVALRKRELIFVCFKVLLNAKILLP